MNKFVFREERNNMNKVSSFVCIIFVSLLVSASFCFAGNDRAKESLIGLEGVYLAVNFVNTAKESLPDLVVDAEALRAKFKDSLGRIDLKILDKKDVQAEGGAKKAELSAKLEETKTKITGVTREEVTGKIKAKSTEMTKEELLEKIKSTEMTKEELLEKTNVKVEKVKEGGELINPDFGVLNVIATLIPIEKESVYTVMLNASLVRKGQTWVGQLNTPFLAKGKNMHLQIEVAVKLLAKMFVRDYKSVN